MRSSDPQRCERNCTTPAAGRPDSLDGWGDHFERNARDAALTLYRIGWEAQEASRGGDAATSPDKLVVIGDKCAVKAFAEETARLAALLATVTVNAEPVLEGAA